MLKLKKHPPDYDLKVPVPQAMCGVRGTEFITKVNGEIATIIVFDGEVEFSDIKKRKTIIVKKGQLSKCQLGGLPTEPVDKESNQVLKWLE